jgi:hypothetical protein
LLRSSPRWPLRAAGTMARDAARLSELRYRGGSTGFPAQAQLNELVSLVEIYRNLGGGWES